MELPHIGKNCDVSTCNQLDFLPFTCDGCGKIFCLQHRSRDDHQCTAPLPEHAIFSGEKSYECSIEGCNQRELTQITCHHCCGTFCLKHRLQEDHKCAKLPQKRHEIFKTSNHVQNIASSKEFKPKSTPTNPKAIQMAAKIALMKLKGKAVGDQSVPQNERVYFNVILPLETQKTSSPQFFSKIWTVGRVIDIIADKASVSNKNNTSTDKKLRLFHADTGCKLTVDHQLGQIMDDTSNLLLNGCSLILENVDDNVIKLENLHAYKR